MANGYIGQILRLNGVLPSGSGSYNTPADGDMYKVLTDYPTGRFNLPVIQWITPPVLGTKVLRIYFWVGDYYLKRWYRYYIDLDGQYYESSFVWTGKQLLIDLDVNPSAQQYIYSSPGVGSFKSFNISVSINGVSYTPYVTQYVVDKVSNYTNVNQVAQVGKGVMPDWSNPSVFYFPGATTDIFKIGSASLTSDFSISKSNVGFVLHGQSSIDGDLTISRSYGGVVYKNQLSTSASFDLSAINGFRVPGSSTATIDTSLTVTARVNPGGYAPNLQADFSTTRAVGGNLIEAQFGQRYLDEDYLVPDYFYPDTNPPTADLSVSAIGNVINVLTTATEELTLFSEDITLTADVSPIRLGESAIDVDASLTASANVTITPTDELTYDVTQDTFAANLIDFGTSGYTEDDYVDPDYFEGFNLRIVLETTSTLTAQAATEVITAADMTIDSQVATTAGYLHSADATLEATVAFDTLGGNGPGLTLEGFTAALDANATLTEAVENLISATANFQAFNDITLISGRIQQAEAQLDTTFTVDFATDFQLGVNLTLTVDTTLTPLVGYGLFGDATLDASNIMLTTGKIVALDDYYIVVVPPETRIINTTPEPRLLLVKPETRITTTPREITTILVEPETRTYKITANKATQIGRRTRRIEQ